MGDPKFSRRKYERPRHPWQGERIKEETDLVHKYGLKNKRELWKAKSYLRRARIMARRIQAELKAGHKQAEKESKQLVDRLHRLGIIERGATLNDVLALNPEVVLARRLQTITYAKGLAFTPGQARQLIVHGHITVTGRTVTVPGRLLRIDETDSVAYHLRSPLSNEQHPMRPTAEILARRAGGQIDGAPQEGAPTDAGTAPAGGGS